MWKKHMETLFFGGRTEAIGIVDVANSMSDLQSKDGDFCDFIQLA